MWRFVGAVLATLVVAFVTACVQLAWADARATWDPGLDPGRWRPVQDAPTAPAATPAPLPFRLAWGRGELAPGEVG